jgi:hypothetical protein
VAGLDRMATRGRRPEGLLERAEVPRQSRKLWCHSGPSSASDAPTTAPPTATATGQALRHARRSVTLACRQGGERRVGTESEALEAVSAGELSQGEAARRLGRSRSYVRYRTDPEYRERDRARHR